MRLKSMFFSGVFWLTLTGAAQAAEAPDNKAAVPEDKPGMVTRAGQSIQNVLEDSLSLIGIRYKRGGSTPDTGFDCSGFVGHVFREGLGLSLPRSAKEISKEGDKVQKEELKPGDLVFFNTMRRAFSHVGIYLGAGLFVHSPRAGGAVRVEDMSDNYWAKRYNGARRVSEP